MLSIVGFLTFACTFLTIKGSSDFSVLLNVKNHVEDPLKTLKSWKTSRDVCYWKGVVCSTQGQVYGLHLQSLLSLSTPLLASVIQDLPQLREFQVSKSKLIDSLDNITLQTCLLEVLDFSSNQLHGSLPARLIATCRNLKVLNLSHNQMSGGLQHGETLISNRLEKIDLSYNNLTGAVPASLFSTCTNLQHLDFSGNNLTGEVPQEIISGCMYLNVISLAYNNFSGAFPSLSSSNNIQRLRLTSNSFDSLVIQECTDLLELDVSVNMLSGRMFSADDLVCPSLEVFNISSNSFAGMFLDTLIGENLGIERILPSVESIDASFNDFTGEVPAIHENLKYLDLSSNRFTNTKTTICSTASFKLERLLLPNNRLTGTVLNSVLECPNLSMIDLTFNSVTGEIPGVLCEKLAKLQYLLAWGNNLEGYVPSTLGNCINLTTILLSYNNLKGTIPPRLSRLKNLRWLDLSNNKLVGKIPSSFGYLNRLRELQLTNNSLDGEIPSELAKCKKLRTIELDSNNLTGRIPALIGQSRPGVERMNMRSGSGYLKLVHVNNLPKCTGMVSWFHVQGILTEELQKLLRERSGCANLLVLMEPSFQLNDTSSVSIDLSYNKLIGEIPTEFGDLKSLYSLFLQHNSLNGTIPVTIGELKGIMGLDLSQNNLQGSIPQSLSQLHFLRFFNVSYNNLTGPIPQGGQLTLFTSSYEGNPGLCGQPLSFKCDKGDSDNPTTAFADHGPDNDYFAVFKLSLICGIISFLFCSILTFKTLTLKVVKLI